MSTNPDLMDDLTLQSCEEIYLREYCHVLNDAGMPAYIGSVNLMLAKASAKAFSKGLLAYDLARMKMRDR